MKYLQLILLIIILGCQSNKVDENENFRIGTKSFIWEDSDRTDAYYGGNRLINVKVWYPGDVNENSNDYQPSQYYYEIDKVYNKLDSWSDEDYHFVSKISTKSYSNYPISKQQVSFPVLLLSPSLGGNISMYTYYAEHLAKKGFIVVGVNHLYESEYVIDDKWKIYPANNKFHDSLKLLNIPSEITAEKYRDVKGVRQKVLGEDLVFSLNKLDEVNQDEFNGKLNLSRVGALGHSIGGAACIYASLLDKQVNAVVNIDGTLPTLAMQKGIDVPFMFIEDLTDYENHQGYKKMHKRRSDFCELNSKDSYRVLIGETNHNSFLDINYHVAKSTEDKEKAFKVIKETGDFMYKFFSLYLKNESVELNEVKTDSLEIIRYKKV